MVILHKSTYMSFKFSIDYEARTRRNQRATLTGQEVRPQFDLSDEQHDLNCKQSSFSLENISVKKGTHVLVFLPVFARKEWG